MKITEKNKKKNFGKKRCIVFGIIIILSLILIVLITINKKDAKFIIESRVQQVIDEQKKDTGEYKTIGWIKVEGTNIDYPIIIDTTGKYKNPVEKDAYGWLNSETTEFTNNLTIDGHNIFNLGVPKKSANNFKRFEELMAYVYYDFAKENQFIQLTMNNKNYLYQVFAVNFMYDLDFSLLPANEISKKEQQKTIDFVKKHSIYKYNIDVNSNDKILNVATCTRLFGKDDKTNFVLSAKLVESEKLKLNRVSKTKEYQKVDKKMKGREKNDKEETESA